MPRLRLTLFGKFSLQCDDRTLTVLSSGKARELFCYLLLHRDRPHSREGLAALLWGDSPTSQSKKYLRQALWQLQSAFETQRKPAAARPLLIDADWVQLNSAADLWLDVAVFEHTLVGLQGVPCEDLDAAQEHALQEAVSLYHGDLLEGWYQDWCLAERERLRGGYLAMIDKLIACYESRGLVENALRYGALGLHCDRAREQTHRRMMRLYVRSGDRTAALRQYDRCIIALDEELGVQPSADTAALYEQIRSGQAIAELPRVVDAARSLEPRRAARETLAQLKRIDALLADVQQRVRGDIELMEAALQQAARRMPTPTTSPRLVRTRTATA